MCNRRVNRSTVAGATGRCNNNVAGINDMRVNDCEDVFECLLALLEEALEENHNGNNTVAGIRNRQVNDCEDVFECLEELLERVLGESNNNHCCH